MSEYLINSAATEKQHPGFPSLCFTKGEVHWITRIDGQSRKNNPLIYFQTMIDSLAYKLLTKLVSIRYIVNEFLRLIWRQLHLFVIYSIVAASFNSRYRFFYMYMYNTIDVIAVALIHSLGTHRMVVYDANRVHHLPKSQSAPPYHTDQQ